MACKLHIILNGLDPCVDRFAGSRQKPAYLNICMYVIADEPNL